MRDNYSWILFMLFYGTVLAIGLSDRGFASKTIPGIVFGIIVIGWLCVSLIGYFQRKKCPKCAKRIRDDKLVKTTTETDIAVGGGFHSDSWSLECPYCRTNIGRESEVTMMYGN